MNPNQDQVLSWVRTTIAGVAGFAIGHGYGSAELWSMISGIAMLVVPYLWGAYMHTSAAKLEAIAGMAPSDKRAAMKQIPDDLKLKVVEAIPSVQRIVVAAHAGNGVQAAASDPARPKVVTQ